MHLLLFCCCSVVASRFPPTSHTATQRQAFGLLQCRLRAALSTLDFPCSLVLAAAPPCAYKCPWLLSFNLSQGRDLLAAVETAVRYVVCYAS